MTAKAPLPRDMVALAGSTIALAADVQNAAEHAARKGGDTLTGYLDRVIRGHLIREGFLKAQTRAVPHATVAVSATVNMSVWDKVRKRAKRERRSITDLVRPLVLAAIERGEASAASDRDVEAGMIISIRLPLDHREAFRALAARKGVTVSRVLAGVIMEAFGQENAQAAIEGERL